MKTAALIVAAGNSVRFGGSKPKQFVDVAGRPLLAWTIEMFESADSVDGILLVVAKDQLLHASEKVVDPYGFLKVTEVVPGGASRQLSVLNGLERLAPSTELVAIHDGARPLTSPSDINAVVEAATATGAAMLAVPMSDTVKCAEDGCAVATIERADLYKAQTPQVFGHAMILEAHRQAAQDGLAVTDDSALLEARGVKVKIVEPASPNLKVTTPEDLRIVEAILSGERHE